MCGIAGILRVHPPSPAGSLPPHWDSIPEPWLDLLDDSIKHRGPDGAGRFRDRARRPDGSVVDVALVHRRLSIIDHSGGGQPMVSLAKGAGVVPVKTLALGEGLGVYEPGDYERLKLAPGQTGAQRAASVSDRSASSPDHPDLTAVVFNGCIYNHRDLRRELQAAGHTFSSDHSDTEVLVHGVREHHDQLAQRLEGMFSYATWSRRRAELILARDWVKEKPLYWCFWWPLDHPNEPGRTRALEELRKTPLSKLPWTVVFGSSIAGILRVYRTCGGVVSPHYSLGDWIEKGYADPPPFKPMVNEVAGVQILGGIGEDGRSRSLTAIKNEPRWWSWETMERRKSGPIPTPDSIESHLESAVRRRLEADVPMACFLSGGVDSPLLALYAKRALGDFRAVTVRMPDARYDESETAAKLAAHIGIKHTILDADPNPADDLMHLIHQLGLPFGDSSILPSLWVSRAARQEVTVALGGDGGDELFAGYERYVGAELTRRTLVRLVRYLPRGFFAGAHPKSKRAKLGRLARSLDPLDSDVGKIFSRSQVKQLFDGDPGSQAFVVEDRPAGTFASGAASLIDWDFCRYLPGDLLRKTDTASMSVALEVRSPYLDYEVMQATLCAPISALMPGNQRKGLLRAVARKHFPAEVVDRPKMGFSIPIGEWFRNNYGGMRDLLLDHLNSTEPFGPPSLGINLKKSYINQLLKEHDDAGSQPWKGRDHSQRLYMVLVLSIWAKWLSAA